MATNVTIVYRLGAAANAAIVNTTHPPPASPEPADVPNAVLYPNLNQLDQYEKIIGVRNNVTDGALLTALWVDVVIGAILVLGFVLVHTRNKIYRIRLALESISMRPPELPTKGFATVYLWIRQVIMTSDLEFLATAGLDALVLCKVVALGIKLFLPFTLVGLLILVPLHMSGDGLRHLKRTFGTPDQQRPLLSYTAANISDKNPVFWVHFVVVYLFTFYAMLLLRWQYYNYVKLREHYMSAGTNDVNYWRQVLAQENPDQRFEHGKYVGALQLVRKLTRTRSEMALDDAASTNQDSNSLTPGHVITNPKQYQDLLSSIVGRAGNWLKRKDVATSRVASPRTPTTVSEEDDTTFLQRSQLTSSMSNMGPLATTAAGGSDDEGGSSVCENEVVLELPSLENNPPKWPPEPLTVRPHRPSLTPLELANLRSNSQTSTWNGLPSLGGQVLSPRLPTSPVPRTPFDSSLPPLPPPWHLRGSGTPHTTFNHNSLTPVIREFKARSSVAGPMDGGCIPPASTPAPPSRVPSIQGMEALRRSNSGAWGLAAPASHRRTTGDSSYEEDPEAYLLKGSLKRRTSAQSNEGNKAAACKINWAWWDKVNLDTQVKQDLSKGRHLLSKPSVRYRTTVNTFKRDGEVVAVNASQYTVLVTDVDEAPFPEVQRMNKNAIFIRWASMLPSGMALLVLRYIFLLDVRPDDLANNEVIDPAFIRRRSVNFSHTSARSQQNKVSQRDAPPYAPQYAWRNSALVPAHRAPLSPPGTVSINMVNSSGWDHVPASLAGLTQAMHLNTAAGEVIAGSPSWRGPHEPIYLPPLPGRVHSRSGAFGSVVRASAPASMDGQERKHSKAYKYWQIVKEAVADGRIFLVKEDVVTRTFRKLFPEDFDRAIPVFRHDEIDQLLLKWDWHQAQLEKARAQKEIMDDPDFEPTETLCCNDCNPGCWSCFFPCAKRVPAIQYHEEKAVELEEQIVAARKRAIAEKYTPSWFVFFKTQKAATLAAHALLHPEDNCKFQVHPAPGPENVNWEALWFGYNHLKWRRVMVFPLLLTIILLPISIFSGALSELDAVLCSNKGPDNKVVWKWYCQDHHSGGAWVFRRLLTGWLPSLLLNLYQNMVIPRVMYYIAQRESYSYSLSGLDARVLEIYFYWDFFNVFLGGVLGQLIIRHLRGLFKSPGSLFAILGFNLPYASNFFFSYIWFRGLVIIPFRMLIPHPGLFCWLFKLGGRWGCALTRREHVQLYETRSVRHGVELGILMLAFLVGLAYCVASPLLAACTLIYFLFAWVFWRYILLYVFVRKYESGGALWPWVFNRICVCLAVFQFFTACVLMVKKAYLQGSIIMFTLPFLTLQFARQCNKSFAKGIRSTPLELADNAPAARIHPSVYIPPPMQPSLVGWYPEWMKAWEGWGAVSYTT